MDVKPKTEREIMLAKALRCVLQYSSPEEGQRWEFKFSTDEKTYADWKDLIDDN